MAAVPLILRMAMADAQDAARLSATIDDFSLLPDARMDDRTRSALQTVLIGLVEGIETDIRAHAVRLLNTRGATTLATTIAPVGGVWDRLQAAGLARDLPLMRELLGRVTLDTLAARLPLVAQVDGGRSLLSRLVDCPDDIVADATADLMALEAQRREPTDTIRSELPAELHHRLVWQCAAAIRADHPGSPDRDRALSKAAWHCIAAHDEGDRVEAAAVRLAAAIDARIEERPFLLIESLGDRRLSLFIAVVAHAAGMDFDQARALVLDPIGDRLWCALRAIGLDQRTMAHIGVALAQADRRRDIDTLADRLDAIMASSAQDCSAAIAPLCLDRDFREAIQALERRP